MRVELDVVSVGMIACAVMLSVYFATFEKGFYSVFPALLLVSGLVLMRLSTPIEEDEYISGGEAESIGLYTAVGIAGVFLVAWLAPQIASVPQSIMPPHLSVINVKLFAIMMAVAEECFFRGFLMSWFARQFNSDTLAVILQAVVFAAYHTAVYGTSPTLMLYVLMSGGILGFVAWRTGRLSTSMLVHSIINIISVG